MQVATKCPTAQWHVSVVVRSLNFPSKAVLYEAVASNPKIVRRVVRVETDGILVHFYLACGHLITERKKDVASRLSSEIECWACAGENKES